MPDTLVRDTALDVVQQTFPIALSRFDPASRPTGLVIVDEVHGFCTVGCGPLAPATTNPQVDQMIAETVHLARRFEAAEWPVLAFLDTHIPGKAEPPYPPHCEIGTGQENLVAELEWLEGAANATLIRKDCINGFIGAIEPDGRNRVLDWIKANELKAVLVVGICTDICVMDFVLTLLSARNHGMAGGLEDVVVYEPACATYDLPRSVARDLGLPETAAHPQAESHHVGLYLMASRGAILAVDVE
ncbi:isochorismatase hydrolase [Skermanella stibiiresistens SB22]|uniref:Isochorismatase hydrolase n=1 Tax=Skermanella stibiiresistens SB22 TaxID=1385369 RepID=W9H3F7_9PROT|nr:isochorismatase family protein [Skermanella stibiiresistens]EWY39326.1 isochorismatase hydrolase [Skermanella stibiiresistens SB22]